MSDEELDYHSDDDWDSEYEAEESNRQDDITRFVEENC
jgi:hypothetical protein